MSLRTILLMMTSLQGLLAVAVMELALWSQGPTLFPLPLTPCLGRHTWNGIGDLPWNGAVFGCEKGLPDPHAISPELWQAISKKRTQAAIREYERDLAGATVAAVATYVPDGAASTQVAPSADGPTYTDDSDVP